MAEYRNSIRTKKFIRHAFAELVDEKKDLSKITVKELTDRADISKSTFYSHYQDIYALWEEFEDEIITTINNTIDEYLKEQSNEFTPYINKLLSLLSENEELYKRLISANSSGNFIDKLRHSLSDKIEKNIKKQLRDVESKTLRFQIELFTNGIIYIVADYFSGKSTTSLKEIAKQSEDFLDKLYIQLEKESKI